MLISVDENSTIFSIRNFHKRVIKIRRRIFQTFSQNILPLLKQIFISEKCQDGQKTPMLKDMTLVTLEACRTCKLIIFDCMQIVCGLKVD